MKPKNHFATPTLDFTYAGLDPETLGREYLEERRSMEDIAVRHGVSPCTVRRRLHALGINRPPGRPSRPVAGAAALASLSRQGLPQTAIAGRLGVTQGTISKRLDRLGLALRKQTDRSDPTDPADPK